MNCSSMRRVVAGLAALGSLALLGCRDETTVILVEATSAGAPILGVSSMMVDVRTGAQTDRLTYRAPSPLSITAAQAITFSVSFSSSVAAGDMEICVTALGATGSPLGAGYQTAMFLRAGDAKARVVLTPGDGRGICRFTNVAGDGGTLDAVGGGGNDATPGDGGVPDAAAATTCAPGANSLCGSGTTCEIQCQGNAPAVAMCSMAGTKLPGESCAGEGDCVAGSQCFVDACNVKTCREYCDPKGAACSGGGACSTEISCGAGQENTGHFTCAQACNPTGDAQTGCAVGLRCFVFPGEIVDCDCVGNTRVKQDGMTCATSDDCAPGLLCVSMEQSGKVCRPVCELAAPQCAEGRKCETLVDPPYTRYGACLPL